MLEVEELLTSPESPLYARERTADLPLALQRCLAVLDGPESRFGLSANGVGNLPDDASSATGEPVLTTDERR